MTQTPNPLAPLLDTQGFIVLDGGLATTLEARGHALDAKLWSAALLRHDPGAVGDVHRAFLDAGADVVATAGYQASFAGFDEAGLGEDEAVELFLHSVEVAVEARDAFWAEGTGRRDDPDPGDSAPGRERLRPLVAASAGPYGAYLADGSEYDGRYGISTDELDAFHRRRFRLLAGSPADLVACETIPSGPETRVLLRILRETPGAWAWLSFSCRDDEHLHDGTPLTELVRACEETPRVAAVGVNCVSPARVPGLIDTMRAETSLPVLAYPNSGEDYDASTGRWRGDAFGEEIGRSAVSWREHGAAGVGGCCRVGPEGIRAIRERLDEAFDGDRR